MNECIFQESGFLRLLRQFWHHHVNSFIGEFRLFSSMKSIYVRWLWGWQIYLSKNRVINKLKVLYYIGKALVTVLIRLKKNVLKSLVCRLSQPISTLTLYLFDYKVVPTHLNLHIFSYNPYSRFLVNSRRSDTCITYDTSFRMIMIWLRLCYLRRR